ncbi:MAG: glycosyltransferase [Actinobacteria bacterium]|nr:glycosyltransferase [Actinomycetota bacterium]
MGMEPLVTCVVISYNYGAYVEAAVRSVLDQQGMPAGALEVIVVDDGSTDDTHAILAGFGDAIAVLRQRNEGPTIATQRALARARGRYVSFLDADDLWLPDKLARHVELLERQPHVGLVHGDMEVIDGDGRVTRPSKYDWYGELPTVGRAFGRLLAQNEATTSSVTARTALVRAVPPLAGDVWCRDWWIAAHVAAQHEVDALREPVARYRVHGDNLSAQDAHSERALELWERDVHVRRTLLRTLPLERATLDELALVWARLAGFLQRVAQGRGVAQATLVPVTDADRGEAAALRDRAQALREADPANAGRLAVKAMAADPFEPASAALFEAVRARRDADPPPTGAERTRAFAELGAAVAAGDPALRRRHAARALVLDPRDDHARALAEPEARLAPPTAQDAHARARFHAPTTRALDGARAFVAAARAEELIAAPALLRAWAAAFAPADDATLAIVTAEPDLEAVHAQLAHTLDAAGLGADTAHDLALVLAPDGTPHETALAREAHALLSDAPAERALAGHPRAGAHDPQALRALAERRWSHDGFGAPLAVSIQICPQRWDGAERWGDTHFARALADELTRRGHGARIEVLAEWDAPERPPADVTIHLRGLWPYVPREDELSVLWNISHPDLVTPAECDAFDLVLTPSARHAEQLAAATRTPVALLEQATDPVVFFPEHDPEHARELVFVGNSRGVFRPILRDLVGGARPDRLPDLAVWGQGWDGVLPDGLVAGRHLPNDAVRRAYSSAALVLNDHWDDMRAQGIVSNRVYDALACGALVVSDHLPELAERFGDAVVTYRTPDDLRTSVERLLADPDERAARAAAGRERVLAAHTFRHRVDALLASIAPLKTASARPILCT